MIYLNEAVLKKQDYEILTLSHKILKKEIISTAKQINNITIRQLQLF